jgi:hypothetical protein
MGFSNNSSVAMNHELRLTDASTIGGSEKLK